MPSGWAPGRASSLVHGFTQTGRSWGPVAADLSQDHEVVSVDAPGHGGSSDVTARPPGGRRAPRRAGGPRHLRRLLDGRPVGAAPGARPAGPRPGPRADRRHGRHRGRSRSGPPAAPPTSSWRPSWSGTGSRRSSSDGWRSRCSRRSRRRPPASTTGCATLRPASPPACAWPAPARSSLCGTSSPSCRCPCSWWPASATTSSRPSAAAWPEAIGPNATFALVPGAGHACHLERPDEFLPVLRGWLLGVRRQRRG